MIWRFAWKYSCNGPKKWEFENFHAMKCHPSYKLPISQIKLSLPSSFQNTYGVKNLWLRQITAQVWHHSYTLQPHANTTQLHTKNVIQLLVHKLSPTTNLLDVTKVTSTHINSFSNAKLGFTEWGLSLVTMQQLMSSFLRCQYPVNLALCTEQLAMLCQYATVKLSVVQPVLHSAGHPVVLNLF